LAPPARQTIGAAITEVLDAHGTLPAARTHQGEWARDRPADRLSFAASVEEAGPREDPWRKMDSGKGPFEAYVRFMMREFQIESTVRGVPLASV